MNAPPEGPAPGELSQRAVAALDLRDRGSSAELLAESALWLALANLEHEIHDDLEAILDGSWWRGRYPVEGEARQEGPGLARAAAGSVLLRCAAEPETGAAERVAAALAVVALGCADAEVGLGLQRGLGQLRLLEIVAQIPLAARIRVLVQEFRHQPLELQAPLPTFMARVEDLLERLDLEQLLALGLRDRASDEQAATLPALIRSRSPHEASLGRVLFRGGRYEDREALLDACLAEAPALWGRQERSQGAMHLEFAYGELCARLEGTSWALCPRGEGRYGMLSPAQTSSSTSDSGTATQGKQRPERRPGTPARAGRRPRR